MTTKRAIENLYPLSPNQKGLLFHALYGPAEGLYLSQTVYELRGEVDAAALRRALQMVMDRHSVLRTAFNWEKRQEPFQVVYRTVNAPWQELDWQDLAAPERQERLDGFLADERKAGFDLTRPPLLRVTFIRLGPGDCRIVWTHHHLLLDGWSLLLLLREFVACYSGRQRDLLPPRPFADYIAWLQRQDLARAEEFWRRMFAECSVPARLSLGARPSEAPESASASDEREAHLDEATTDALRALARRNGLTLNSLAQGAWAICLGRMSYEPDVVFGTTVSGRPSEMSAFETMVGMFVNALPVRISVALEEPLVPWLHRLQSLQAEMRRFEHTPLVDIQGWSGLPRTQALFESLMTFQRFGVEGAESEGGAAALDIRQTLSVERTNYDLTLVIGPGRTLGLRMVYDGGRFESLAITTLLRRLLTLFEGMVADSARRLGELPFLNSVERHQVHREWNDTAREYRGVDSCLHTLFEEQVKRTAEAPAVVYEARQLTYDELNRQANRVGRLLKRHGVGRGSLVGLCVERSLEMVVGLLGVLKAGAAFLPLDPSYPEENLAFLLEDAEVSVVLTQEHLSDRIPNFRGPTIRLDGDREAIAREGRTNLGAPCTSEDLAYVIYTSGSTGRPKGARLHHLAVVNRILWMLDRYPLDGADRVVQKTPFSFDVSVSEFFGTLISGACLVVARPEGHRDMSYLAELLAQEGITQLQVVPSMLDALLAEARFADATSLRRVFSGGEALSYDLRERFLARSNAELYNLYGPTETAIDVTLHVCGGGDRHAPLPIGRPIGNLQVLVLDRGLELLPIGATGQLHVGGAGLGRGYLRRPDLTAERFIPHPWGASAGERLYVTGDLVRLLPEGEVDFLGRSDSQVKIRGVRVELSEIEVVLSASEGIKSAVVLSQEGRAGGRVLVAHVVPAEGAPVRTRELRDRLRTQLPEHMVPAHFVLHESLPLTTSGKIDRRSLAQSQPFAEGERTAYVPPRTPIEEMVAGFLAEVLRLERVGSNDNLFDLGGHSLMAMQLVARLRGTLGVELPLRTVFEAPTVAAMAAGIEAQLVGERDFTPPPLVPASRDMPLPLSFAQERLWFLDQLDPGSSTYNVPLALGLRGRLQVPALAASLDLVIRRHEVLRTHFPLVAERPIQEIFERAAANLALADLKALPDSIRDPEARRIAASTAQRPFDLARGPLLRAALLLLEAERWLVLLTLHHIVADGWSLGILTREVGAAYGALCRGDEVRMEPLVVQYADFAAWQRDWLAGDVLERQLAWWRSRLETAPRLLDLPLDRPRPPVQRFRGGQIAVRYPVDLRNGLAALGRNSGATLFMVVLSGFATLLSRLSGQDDLVVGSVVANRSRLEVEALIGFFVNTLALRVDLALDPTFGALVRQLRESALGAYVHQDVPFEKLVEDLQPERNLSYSPLFQTALVFQNAPLENLELAAELVLEPLGEDRAEGAKFDLTLSLGEDAQGLGGHLHYNPDLFDRATVVRLIEHLGCLLAAAVERQGERVSRLPIQSPAQRHQLVFGWNDTAGDSRRDGCVHEMVERQAGHAPEAVALSYGSFLLTYRELNASADGLARRLRRFGVGPEARVGICMSRSAEAVVAFLGVLKAGGAYVPLDPTYPQERLSFMLADSGAQVVITQPQYRERLPQESSLVVCMLGEREEGALESAAEVAESPSAMAANLAYLMYTSGSTGKPKGVAIPHGALNWFVSTLSYVAPRSTDRFAQGATHSFDAATFEIWGALANGGTVVGLPKDVMISPRDLAAELKRQEITVLYLTAALFMQTASQEPTAFGSLRRLLVGGEVVDLPYFQAVERDRPEQVLYLYGPTETTVFSTWYDVAEIAQGDQKASIGRPIHEAPHYLLGRDLEPAALGAFGEAYIGGGGLAREYWMRPDLTAERFVPNPFGGLADEPGSRIYRSGDFIRHLPDGKMEFRSRVDTQLKIRGFRVEPKEIEATLTRRPGVREALVVAREDAPGDKRLVAYVVAESGGAPDPAELRAALASELPDYMVPSAFVRLPALPLTPNGKVDHAALPAPAQAEAPDSAVAPRTPTEEILGDLWSEVLRRDRVGVHEDFFALGGHSLLATQVISRLRGVFGVDLPLRELFENPTVSGLAARLDAQIQASSSMPPWVHLAPAARPVEFPLSFAQQRMWFITQLEPESAAYNVAIPLVLKGDLDVAVLARSFGEVVRRHEALRTAYRVVDGQPIQEILPAASWKFPEIDLRALPATERRPEVWRLAGAEASRPFELADSPPLRVGLIYSGPEEYAALFTIHHINCDGWSMGVLIRDLSEIYAAFREGRPSPIPELAVQYADFAVWQREWLHGSVLEEQLGYWRRQLGGGLATLQLPLDRPRPAVRSHRGSRLPLRLSADLSSALNELGRESNSTFFMTLLAAFTALLNRYAGQRDVMVGTPISGRHHAGLEAMIGLFANSLALRLDVVARENFLDLLGKTRATALAAYAHQDVPFEKIVEAIQVERDASRTPIFQVVFTWQNAGMEQAGFSGIDLETLDVGSGTAQFDLTLALIPGAEALFGGFEFNTDLFDHSTIQRMSGHFQALLNWFIANPDRPIGELPLMAGGELHQLLVEWSGSEARLGTALVHEVFEEQVDLRPDALAVITQGEQVTFACLEEKANRLAHHLQAMGVKPETLVGLCLERSLSMVVAMLGILKAGGSYVPIDPAVPAERVSLILEDTFIPILVGDEATLANIPAGGMVQLVALDSDRDLLERRPNTRQRSGAEPENLAYVMYTSGSTGRPKGVGVTHLGVVRLVRETDYARFGAGEVFLQLAPVSFDASTFEIWGSLLNGSRLVIAAPGPLAIEEVHATTSDFGVTTMWLTAGLFHELANTHGNGFGHVDQLLAGGDVLLPDRVRSYLAGSPGGRLINGYGPTENTTFSCCHPMTDPEDVGASVPIGRPVANTRVYVVDSESGLVPAGVEGELFVGGHGLARGYFNQPALTAEVWVPDAVSGRTGERLYRTGDRVRWRSRGSLEFLGRLDEQVKVRGFRIEPAEVEAALTADSEVQAATVVLRQDEPGEKKLVAYVVPAPGCRVTPPRLRESLRQRLPDYMVPSTFVILETLPLTPNGKIDRRALPAPDAALYGAGDTYAAPRNQVEEILAAIWGRVLGVERIGAYDNFFDLGGHSLLATRVVSQLRAAFDVEVPLHELFERPTVAGLSERVEEAIREGVGLTAPPLSAARRGAVLPLSFAQQRLWFIDQFEPGSSLYNMHVALRIEGRLSVAALAVSLSRTIERQESLRTIFRTVEGEPVQEILPAGRFALAVLDLSGLSERRLREEASNLGKREARRPFDLSRGPLFRCHLLSLGRAGHVILMTMHHIVSDGWSMRLLVREIGSTYAELTTGEPSRLPDLPVQYADFVAWQRSWLQGEVLERQLAYWRDHLRGVPPVLNLPTDKPRPAVQSFRGSVVAKTSTEALSTALRALSRQEGATPFMTILSGFAALLGRYAAQSILCVGIPIAGRNHRELEVIVGFFVNTLALRIDLGADPTFSGLLEQVRAVSLAAHAHQDLPFEKLVAELEPERSTAHSPLFQVMFDLTPASTGSQVPAGLRMSAVDEDAAAVAKFDLSLGITESSERMVATLEYATDLFEGSTAARLLEHLDRLLQGAVEVPERRISSLPLLSEGERGQLTWEWNDNGPEIAPGGCLQELFTAQARRTPDAVALVSDEVSLSYRELDGRANQVAHRLRALGVGPERIVGVLMERCPRWLEAVLGVLKAGAAYLPLATTVPGERLDLQLRRAGVDFVLTQERFRFKVPAPVHAVCWEDAEVLGAGREELPAMAAEGNVAYTIFTSGSTGRPKGVLVEHRSAAWYAVVAAANYGIDRTSRVLQHAALDFDISIEEIFPTLSRGATLVLSTPLMQMSVAELLRRCGELEITHLAMATALWNEVCNEVVERPSSFPPTLRLVCMGGEKILAEKAAAWHRNVDSRVRLVNSYGPTETTVVATIFQINSRDCLEEIPIGRPIRGARAYVLDPRLQIVPASVPGELLIGGAGVARGYLNEPAMTAVRFVPDPFSADPGERLYRTGDLVRFLPDGNLRFVGRIDDQVKVRGFRVEPGEIETLLLAEPGVLDAAVMAEDQLQGMPRLVAYLARVPEGFSLTAVRGSLRRQVPDYMVPASFVVLDRLPTTPSGKVDRRLLRQLALVEEAGNDETRLSPRTPIEELTAGVWADVLGVERVNADDNFFALGGHSLLATRVMARLRGAFGVELALRELFEAPTVASFSLRIEAALRSRAGLLSPPLSAGPRDGSAPLSFAQQRLWFLDQLEPGSPLYNLPLALRVEGRLSVPALAHALSEVVRRHEVLRTVFSSLDGVPTQVIGEGKRSSLPLVDLSGLPPQPREFRVRALAGAEASRPFDLSRGPLLRAWLVRLGAESHAAFLTMHHIASDGWSLGILVREVTKLYEGTLSGRPSDLPALPVQYADYARWQRSWLEGEVLAEELAHWRGELSGLPVVLELPTDRPRPSVQSFRGAERDLALDRGLSEGLDVLARVRGVTPFMVLLAVYAVVLDRYAGQDEVAVGTPIAGRTHVELEDLIGFFVNTLVLRLRPSSSSSFAELLSRSRETVLSAYAHQSVPFERLVEELAPERSLSHSPLFQVMLVLQNAPQERLEVGGLSLSPLASGRATSKFDLTLAFSRSDRGYLGAWEFSADLFDGLFVERMGGHLVQMLSAVVDSPESALEELAWLTAGQQAQLLREWNDTSTPPGRLALHQLFEEQAKRNPGAVALANGGERLAYGELEGRANRLARYLVRAGARPGDLVGLFFERSIDLVVAVLGVLKAGCAYLPLDPAYPKERLSYLLADSAVAVVLTAAGSDAALGDVAVRIVRVDEERQEIESESSGPLNLLVPLEQAAYVIYTSGSTGRPKGVVVSHGNVVRLFGSTAHWFDFGSADVWTLFHSYAFDFSVWELWGALLYGGRLVVVPYWVSRSPDAFLALLAEERVTVLNQTPSAFRQLQWIEESAVGEALSLRLVIFGGEALEPSSLSPWVARHGDEHPRLINMYGITETTVHVTYRPITRTDVESSQGSPIGRPIPDLSVHVMTRRGCCEPVPIGVPGELQVGGAGLAQGYLNRPELTAERFVPDPFASVGGGRLYRTGDLVRWRGNGELEFLGRIDHQVKIRGFRIELGEIEAVLSSHAEVRQAAVILWEKEVGDRRLVAYVAAERATTGELLRYLRERLPDYMVPSTVVSLAQLPSLPNGKVDRRALGQLTPGIGGEDEKGYLAPRSPIDELVAGVWAAVLGVERVGAEDNFFTLGGHSLLATQVIARLRSACGVELALRELFEAPTVSSFSLRIEAALRSQAGLVTPPLLAGPRAETVPLSFAQQRLWFLDQLDPESPLYNLPLALRVEGRLSVPALSWALREVVHRHEVLRTVFTAEEGVPVQVIRGSWTAEVRWPVVDLAALPPTVRGAQVPLLAGAEAARPFDLSRGPLLRAWLIRLGTESYAALLTMHHIASDGWSLGILVREMTRLYEGALSGSPTDLPALPVQYSDYALWQRSWLGGEVLERELEHWRTDLADLPAVLELPTDRSRPSVQSSRGAERELALGWELSEALDALARERAATPFMVLLAGYATLLDRYAGQGDVTVGTPIAGRTHLELEGLIGFFVNTLVLRLCPEGAASFAELLSRARETVLSAYAHQSVPFERLVEELAPERSLSHSPLFQAMLVLQNAPQERLEVAGLSLSPLSGGATSAKFDLSLALERSDRGYEGRWEYAADLFDATTIERASRHLSRLLDGCIAEPEAALARLPWLGASEVAQLEREWNDTGAPVETRCLHDLIALRAAATPDALAVVDPYIQLTYRGLDGEAERLSRVLCGRGIGPEATVALLLDRRVETIVAILAVLKAGGCYVPIDPLYPAERRALMLEDSGAALLLTRRVWGGPPGGSRLPTLLLDEPWQAPEGERQTAPGSLSGQAAYLMYTSGSSGRPKGVVVEHRSVAAYATVAANCFGIHPGERVFQFSSLSFDISIEEIFPCLISGATLVMPRDPVELAADRLMDWCGEREVTFLTLPTAYWHELAIAVAARPQLLPPSLRAITIGGESVLADRVAAWRSVDRRTTLINSYGPTEATVIATLQPLSAIPAPNAGTRIGRPMPNARVYVLRPSGDLAPQGVPGELMLAGTGLARGYLGRVETTAERFVPDPFSGAGGARLYRTGDRARWMASGELEYLGRLDHQTKIRGFRIELGEIEAALASCPGVRQAAVVVKEGKDSYRRLMACVVAENVEETELRRYLGERLPEYMVPSAYALLPALPSLPNGKVDRKALTRLDSALLIRNEGKEAPRDRLELALAAVWEEVLGSGPVGVQDNFFAIGGHSLLAVRLMARIEKVFGRRPALATIFQAPTVELLASVLREGEPSLPASPLISIQPLGEKAPLFCVHPAHGNVLCYLDLARRLGTERPFYGFQSRGLEGEEGEIEIDLEAIAADYLGELLKAQPHGPYHLGGWSMGGVVAYEMAQQLRRRGEEVVLLVLIDSFAPDGVVRREDTDELELLSTFVPDLGIPFDDGLCRDLHGLDRDYRLRLILQRAEEAKSLPAYFDLALLRRLFSVFERNVLAAAKYAARPFAGRVVLLEATEREESAASPAPAWAGLTGEYLEVVPVPGRHHNLLRSPQVEVLAEKLKKCMEVESK